MAVTKMNPFTPTFGRVPFALAGRNELIDDVMYGLANQPGDPNRATIFIGPRGSGKTVLLSTIAQNAAEQGWISVYAVAAEGMFDKVLRELRQRTEHILEKASDYDITSVQVGSISVGREMHRAEEPIWFQVKRLVEELNRRNIPVLFTVDEIDPGCKDLIEFIAEYQTYVMEEKDVALLMAGLPSKVSDLLLDEHVSFIRRSFQRTLGPIDDADVREALRTTIEAGGKSIDEDALEIAVEATGGFAFAIQLVGYGLWRCAGQRERITMVDAERAIKNLTHDMEHMVVIPTLREISPREIDFLHAMAQDEGPSSMGEIAHRMSIGMSNASNLRRRLIDRGIISGPRVGMVMFEMPLIRNFLRGHPEFRY